MCCDIFLKNPAGFFFGGKSCIDFKSTIIRNLLLRNRRKIKTNRETMRFEKYSGGLSRKCLGNFQKISNCRSEKNEYLPIFGIRSEFLLTTFYQPSRSRKSRGIEWWYSQLLTMLREEVTGDLSPNLGGFESREYHHYSKSDWYLDYTYRGK